MKNEKDELIFWKLLKHNKTTEASVEFIVLLVLVVDMSVSVTVSVVSTVEEVLIFE